MSDQAGSSVRMRIGAQGVTRCFGAVQANADISFGVRPGSIHALVGANGAGKSTLMRILQGLEQPDAGRVIVNDQAIALHSPADAIARGIGMVHQEFMLVPELSLLDNLILAHEPRHATGLARCFGLIDHPAASARAETLQELAGVQLDWALPAQDAPVYQRQVVEILRLLHRGADVLILDEPTAVLAPTQVRMLLSLLRRLRDSGHTIVFISHKLHEVLALADDITVLRAGRVVAQVPVAQAQARQLRDWMLGSLPTTHRPSLEPIAASTCVPVAEPALLEVSHLQVRDSRGVMRVRNAHFGVAKGEILGIAGVAGNGQDELLSALAGLSPMAQGQITLCGIAIGSWTVARRLAAGLAYLSPDRGAEGLCLNATITDNAVAGAHRRAEFTRLGCLRWARLRRHALQLLQRFGVVCHAQQDAIRTLSGGNQQRVALARALAFAPALLLAAQPTRGVDVQGVSFIHQQLRSYVEHGGAVLLLSEDLDELIALSDRIGVMHAGHLVGVLPRAQASTESLGRMMLEGMA